MVNLIDVPIKTIYRTNNIFEGSKYKDETIILGKMIESFPEDKSIFYCLTKTQIIISLSKLDDTSKIYIDFLKI